MATYHAEAMIGEPLCGELDGPDDQVVPIAELHRPDGRHFNCVRCHKILSGNQKHVAPPPDWDGAS